MSKKRWTISKRKKSNTLKKNWGRRYKLHMWLEVGMNGLAKALKSRSSAIDNKNLNKLRSKRLKNSRRRDWTLR
jgi:hypothetical protein